MMASHQFTLILTGIAELTPEVADALFEATGGDIELEMRNGVACVEFDRDAPSLRDAILSAIEQVENAGVNVRVVRVDSPAANTIARINAELLSPSS